MASKQARYTEGARITDDGWTVTSQTGLYLAEDALFQLGGNVLAVSDQDTLRSDSLHWVKPDDHYTFLGATTWRSPEFEFTCQVGDLLLHTEEDDDMRPTGWLAGTVRVADRATPWKATASGSAKRCTRPTGTFELASADRQTVVHGQRAGLGLADSLDLVFGNAAHPAWLRQVDGEDTLHISGLELRRAPNLLTVVDSVWMDSEDLQGEGDSLVWDDRLGQIDVFGSPRLWSQMDLLSGDSLTMFLDENRPELLWMRGHAVVLSPANDTLSHRISGRYLDAHFVEGQLDLVDVLGNGQLSYFMVPEPGQDGEVRVNQAVCSRVSLNVDDNALVGVALSQSPEGGIRTVGEGFDLARFKSPNAPPIPLGKLLNRATSLIDMSYLRRCMANDDIFDQVEGLFEAYLEQNGHRKTPERFAILRQVYSYDGHFDVDTLYEVMGKGEYRVSRATLYNTLDLLLDCNLVRRHQFGDQSAQYEKCHRVKQHDHVILADTGEVLEFCDPRIQQIKATLEEIFDIEVMHHSLNIYARKRATTPAQHES